MMCFLLDKYHSMDRLMESYCEIWNNSVLKADIS